MRPWGAGAQACAILAVVLVTSGPARLYAQSTAPSAAAARGSPAGEAAAPAAAFSVQVQAPKEIQAYLLRHLDLLRYRTLADLDDTELERLVLAANANVRELLGTLGYFAPEVTLSRQDASEAGAGVGRVVRVVVQPGPQTEVASVALDFRGAIEHDPASAGQREAIVDGWTLPAGQRFTREAWDDAKTHALRLLSARRYPRGRIAASRAEIDPQNHAARLALTLDSGPLVRLGALTTTGLVRHDPQLVQRIARLAPGSAYDQDRLLEAQQRLQDSGYFNSVVLELDPDADPQASPVRVTVREALRNRLQLGIGVSTDSGVRLSAEHTSLQLPLIGWRSDAKFLLDGDTRLLQGELLSPPDDSGWRWTTLGRLQHESVAGLKVRSQTLRGGRQQLGERIDRNYYLQYDRATTTTTGLNETAHAVTANYAWTQRRFDRLPYPSSGYGLGAELGGGVTLGSRRTPFFRTHVHWLGIWPLEDSTATAAPPVTSARTGRIALRLEGGAVMARDSVDIPSTQLFLAGGDASIRGYAYRSIGAPRPNGTVVPGRYLAVASLEWQRPILVDGLPSPWEGTLFVDAGAVADRGSQFDAKVGVGAGVRYRSPVGPLQLDLAYGLDRKALRLHLSVGFTF